MPINADTAGESLELTTAEAKARFPDRFFPSLSKRFGPLPDSQRYVVIACAVNGTIGTGDQAAIETAVQAIPGIQRAFARIYGRGPAVADLPAGREAQLRVTTRIEIV